MTLTITPHETLTMTALRALLLDLLPDGIEVIRGQANKVASPKSANYVIMTPLNRIRLATNTDTWDQTIDNPTVVSSEMPTMFETQLDVHGEGSADLCQAILHVFRSGFAAQFMLDNDFTVVPQYATDPHQAAFITGEAQFEDRWIMTVAVQIVSAVDLPTAFADAVAVTVVDVT